MLLNNKRLFVNTNSINIDLNVNKDISIQRSNKLTTIVFGYPYDIINPKWLTACEISEMFIANGTDFLNKIDGIFVIIIISGKNTFVITDAFGVYKLYFCNYENKYFISDKLKKIIDQIDCKEFDEIAINDFILSGYVIGNKTFFKKVKKFSAGSIYKFKQTVSIEKYHKIIPKQVNSKHFIEMFNNHIFLGKKLSKEIILPLTAGLDSRVVLSGMNNYTNDLTLFTHINNDNVDMKQAKKICEDFKLKHKNHLWNEIYSKKNFRKTLEEFQSMINAYLFIPLYGSHESAEFYGDTLWNSNGGEIYRNYFGKFCDNSFDIIEFGKQIIIPRSLPIPLIQKDAFYNSLNLELKEHSEFECRTKLNIYYILNRYANFSGYSLQMSGKLFKIFQPFVAKDLIKFIIGMQYEQVKNGKMLKEIIKFNDSRLTKYKINGKSFENKNYNINLQKLLQVKNKFSNLFKTNYYKRIFKDFHSDFKELYDNPHPLLERYLVKSISDKQITRNYYYFTNLMTLNEFLKS
ncbi:MAG: hypothetical protein K9N40_04315 [Candidatus Cloacimonetes bacterium]|nr:hypothetical protein [Candidatus Cloacimonadota bacterium]